MIYYFPTYIRLNLKIYFNKVDWEAKEKYVPYSSIKFRTTWSCFQDLCVYLIIRPTIGININSSFCFFFSILLFTNWQKSKRHKRAKKFSSKLCWSSVVSYSSFQGLVLCLLHYYIIAWPERGKLIGVFLTIHILGTWIPYSPPPKKKERKKETWRSGVSNRKLILVLLIKIFTPSQINSIFKIEFSILLGLFPHHNLLDWLFNCLF